MVKNIFMIIPIPNVHMVRNTLKFTNTWNNCLSKTKKIPNIYKKDINKKINDVAFPRYFILFYIYNYLVVKNIMIEAKK